MGFQTYYLSNGIPVYIKEIQTSFKVCIDILVLAGSSQDPETKKGLAHFLEHMMFRGTHKRDYRQISVDTLKIGGYLNAYTEKDTTTYTMDVLHRQVDNALDILLDLFSNPQFSMKELEKEKTVILEEIDMYNDIPSEFLMDRFLEILFATHPFGTPILGSRKSVQNITCDDIQAFYDQWYYDKSLTIAITGRVKPDEVFPKLEEAIGKRKIRENQPVFVAPLLRRKQMVRYYRDVDQGQMILGVHAPGLEDNDRLVMQVMNAILGGNEISRLYQLIREDQGLAYAVDTSYDAWLGTGCFYVSVGLDPQKIDKVEKLIIEEWEKIKTELVSEEELLIAKNSLEGSKIMELEGAGAYNLHMGAMAVRGLPADPEDIFTQLKEISAEDILRVANRVLDTQNYVLAALLPKKNKATW